MKKGILIVCFSFIMLVLVGCGNATTKTTKEDTTTTQPITTTSQVITTSPIITSDIDYSDTFDMDSYMEDYLSRRNYMVDYLESKLYESDLRVAYGHAFLTFKEYERTNDEKLLEKGIQEVDYYLNKSESGISDSFSACFLSTLYVAYNKYFPTDIKDRYIAVMKNYQGYAPDSVTPNITLFAAVGRYLAEQEFPGEITVKYPGYNNNDPLDDTGEKAIRKVLKEYPKYGVFEYNSDTYATCHLCSLMCLALAAKDEEIRTLALMNYENALFSYAPIYLEGYMCVSSGRTYYPYQAQNRGGATNLVLWLYFGSDATYPTKADLDFCEIKSLSLILASDFIPNWICMIMARDRSEAYTHLEQHYYPPHNRFAFMQSYMTDSYSVFSSKLLWPTGNYTRMYGDISNGMENRTGGFKHRLNWAVRYITDDPEYYGTFSIQNLHHYDDSRDTVFGSSMYEQVFQHENTVIGVFDVPSDYNFPDIVIYEPANFKAIIDESYLGRQYIHYGNVIIAFQLSQPFASTIEETDYGDKIRCGAVTKGWFVCETFNAEDIDGDTYMDQLYYVQSLCEGCFKKVTYDYTSNTQVEYKNSNGVTLSMRFGGDSQDSAEKINGELVNINYLNYPVQENPWVKQNWNEKVITYSYKGYSYTLDFDNKTTKFEEE